MREMIEPHPEIMDIAVRAVESLGIEPLIKPVRGGTDGSRLSYMGLPTPNLFTGGHYFHGKYEFIPTFAMEKRLRCWWQSLNWLRINNRIVIGFRLENLIKVSIIKL